MTPDQIDSLEQVLFLLFSLLFVPIAWLYAGKRGRRPWLWATLALLISWIAVLLLRLLPDKRAPAVASQGDASVPDNENGAEIQRVERIKAEQHLRDLLRNDPHRNRRWPAKSGSSLGGTLHGAVFRTAHQVNFRLVADPLGRVAGPFVPESLFTLDHRSASG